MNLRKFVRKSDSCYHVSRGSVMESNAVRVYNGDHAIGKPLGLDMRSPLWHDTVNGEYIFSF